ncbi:PQQ-binding-like beta-propeller repeat protein [Brachybacterium sacelli]|uniref:Outer membrane protein assembly factor BamB/predicted phosphodiesterase n=1 Tax=Brachybacterium sacelli TaxID=173364 RepID=A0ABS4WYW2_9MICO|nr:PQQ-binding-like beta-propeller repeat protein [Brachybacterium sacelli]MBP2381388.1 outer membrane protein assembly factor BamB/predicted phosphodiesterase [Brachybacterium sacelli]
MTHRLSRRTALTALSTVGAAGAAVAHAEPAAAASGMPQPADPSGTGLLRFVFLADTHTDPENEETMTRLGAVLGAVEQFAPDLVMHGGDVTEHGTVAEYEAFDAAVPDALRDRIVAVPGNHETRWDPTAAQRRHRFIGEDVRVRDAGGVRVILADTTTHQQEVAWWSDRALTDLDEAMSGAKNLPRILVTHFPMGEGYYYVANQQQFEDVLSRHPIPLHLTGHTHRELLTRVNRRDQLEAAAVKIDAAYYELTGRIDRLEVTRVEIPDVSAPARTVRTPVTTYDLRPEHGKDDWMPREVVTGGDVASLALDVTLPGSFRGSVDATLYDTSVYAGRNDDLRWTPLQGRRRRFSGSLEASLLARGDNRVQVRVRPEDQSGNRLLTVPFVRGDRGIAWETRLEGMIQGSPARVRWDDGELLVVADSSGQVLGLDPSGTTQWSCQVAGEVRHDLLTLGDGRSVAVPDTAGFLHLLAADGSQRWRYDADAPFAADPGAGPLAGTEALMACSGSTLHALDVESGRPLWTVELPAPSMGAPASDGERVFLGVGDGCVHALDGRTGTPLWTTSLTEKAGSYQRFIYGPWNDAITVLPDGGVIASGIDDAWCLEPTDGSTRWRLEGSFQYAREAVTDDGDLVMATESGEIVRVDPVTGQELARHATAERILDEGFVLVDGVVYAASHSGLVTAVHLATGDIEQITRISTAPVLAPGVAFGDCVVFVDLAGTVHAVERV